MIRMNKMNMNQQAGYERSKLSKPSIVGYMSVDLHRQYHRNLSQLKYLNAVPKGVLSLNLNYNIEEAVKRSTDDNDEKIELLLRFLTDNKAAVTFLSKPRNDIMNFPFICYRRTLITVMCSAFNTRDPWCIMATLFKGCIYLCTLETEAQVNQRRQRTAFEAKCCAWGYKFEQYLLSDHLGEPPDVQKPVIENEEFSLFYHTYLDSHQLLYGAQIDGMLATNNSVQNPPDTDDPETIVKYLRNQMFVELKTNREILNRRQEQNFRRHKLLRCWCQCYLAGLKGLLVGFRNDNGIIQRLQCYDTEEIESYCKGEWDPQTAILYLNSFLDYVKSSFKTQLQKQYNHYNSSCPDTISLCFQLDFGNSITSSCEHTGVILPDWFIQNLTKTKNYC